MGVEVRDDNRHSHCVDYLLRGSPLVHHRLRVGKEAESVKKRVDLLIAIHRLFGQMMSEEMENELLDLIDWLRSNK